MTPKPNNPAALPENIVKRMSPEARKELGVKTQAEHNAAFDRKREKEVHRDISNYLRLKGIWFSHARMDRKTTQECGHPDYLLCIESVMADAPYRDPFGQAYAIEVKVGTNKLTAEQEKVRDQMIANGWNYFVVSSLAELRKAVGI